MRRDPVRMFYAFARGFTVGLPSRERLALLELDDLLEALAEIELEVVPFRPAEMRRAQHVVHLQKRMVAAGDRLLLVDVHRRIARPALLQRLQQRARLDQFGARDVDEQRGRLHPREILGTDDAAGLRPSRTLSDSTSERSNRSALLFAAS